MVGYSACPVSLWQVPSLRIERWLAGIEFMDVICDRFGHRRLDFRIGADSRSSRGAFIMKVTWCMSEACIRDTFSVIYIGTLRRSTQQRKGAVISHSGIGDDVGVSDSRGSGDSSNELRRERQALQTGENPLVYSSSMIDNVVGSHDIDGAAEVDGVPGDTGGALDCR